MSLEDVITALRNGGARIKIDTPPLDQSFRVTIGRPNADDPSQDEWLAENGSVPTWTDAETFFREQAAVYFPGITLP